MTLGEKIAKGRKGLGYTQEKLAEVLGVTRQSVSKWEGSSAYPETDKIRRMAKLFSCSVDYLLDDEKTEKGEYMESSVLSFSFVFRERKSSRTLWGLPLYHIGKKAKGIIAIGFDAQGILSIGFISSGVVSLGLLSLGFLSLGVAAFGLLAAGSIAGGIMAFGAVSIGVVSFGALSIGEFAVGAKAVGQYFAKGDSAKAMVAVGRTKAVGEVFQKVGTLTMNQASEARVTLSSLVPGYLKWAFGMVKGLIH